MIWSARMATWTEPSVMSVWAVCSCPMGVFTADAVFRASDFAPEDVGDAEEAGNAGGAGVLKHVGTGADLEDLAGVHDGDAVADVAGLGEVVGDHEHGEVQVADEAAEFAAEGEGDAFVEGGEGFVQQEGLGAADQGSGQGGALGLAAGDPGGTAVGQVLNAEGREQAVDPLLAFGAG